MFTVKLIKKTNWWFLWQNIASYTQLFDIINKSFCDIIFPHISPQLVPFVVNMKANVCFYTDNRGKMTWNLLITKRKLSTACSLSWRRIMETLFLNFHYYVLCILCVYGSEEIFLITAEQEQNGKDIQRNKFLIRSKNTHPRWPLPYTYTFVHILLLLYCLKTAKKAKIIF